MKKVLSIIAMATLAVLFCGCNKENAPATGSKSVTISASMPDDEITKTELNGTTLLWKEHDEIHLSGLDNALTWAGNDAVTSGRSFKPGEKITDFTATFSPDWDHENVVVGYYGKKENRKEDSENNYRDGGWYPAYEREDSGGAVYNFLFYTNPCVQKYYNGNGPNGDYLAMADIYAKDFSTAGGGKKLQFQFENLMSIIKIPVSSSRDRILETIKVVGDDSPLSGVFYCWKIPAGGSPEGCWFFNAMTGNNYPCEPIAEDFSLGTYGNWVKLDNINVTLKESAQYFYLVVFPGDHTTLEFTLTDRDGNKKVVTWNDNVRLGAGKIYNFPTITWD